MVLSYTGVAKKLKFKIFCTPHSTQYFVVLCHVLATTTTSIPPLQMKMEKTIETTGRIPLTTQVQYTHTKSISCLEGSDAMRCKHIAKRVHLVTKVSLTFLFFDVCSFSSFIQQSWFPPMYKSPTTPLDFYTWFAVGFISTISSRYPKSCEFHIHSQVSIKSLFQTVPESKAEESTLTLPSVK